ncbi:FUSC family protein [Xanthobacter tagetidis]|uniref:FUSC family protein n=1 Tax=Xanthobacter tagetidis TaxID=60216 RepID=A0A3L7A385_9HYPH|nr:FUSC family protein [Xanthobacter tagetidis]MBB6307760.1 putative membrane protein YccC [Xanthobacter tagetidis]RLP74388.1 FUSC family protein [Xanthobacter tagetidis]
MTTVTREPAGAPAAPGADRPGAWLRELARLKPAPWEWGRALRAAACVCLPWALGLSLDAITTGLWISLGTLMAAAGEPAGSYDTRLRQVLGATLIGAFGFLAGYLGTLPWPAVVAAMTVIAFAAGLLSSLGAVASIGAMQALLVASIAIGVPAIGSFWQAALLFLAGAVFYATALAIEGFVTGARARRTTIAGLLISLAALAKARQDHLGHEPAAPATAAPEVEAARRAAVDRLSAFGTYVLDTRWRAGGRNRETDRLAAILRSADAAFAAILSAADGAALEQAAHRLDAAAEAMVHGEAIVLPQGGTAAPLGRAIARLCAALGDPESPADGLAPEAPRPASALMDRLMPGREVVRSAAALALCMGIAYAAHWFITAPHWFWIPLTVSLVMKPDLGSIFARAVLRSAGTVLGAAVGALALMFLPKGLALVAAMAVFAALVPWAMRRSYALQAVVLTPLVLVLVDLIVPGPRNLDYGIQRIADTVTGGLIVLVFGYFLWPRTHLRQLSHVFHEAKGAIAGYLVAIADGGPPARVSAGRRAAYRRLSGMRAHLQAALAEPPPACHEAVAWFPLIAAAERICDRITAFSATPVPLSPADAKALRALAARIAAHPDDGAAAAVPAAGSRDGALGALFDGVADELDHMARLRDAEQILLPPRLALA